MRHRKAAIGAAGVLALGVGATAVAAPGGNGPLGGMFGPDREGRQAEQARDLAKELHLPENRVRRAIERVGDKRRAEHRAEMAKALAKQLGVSQADAAKALDKGRTALEKQFQSQRQQHRFRPRAANDAFVKAIAGELNKSTEGVRKALKAARREKLDGKLDEAVKEGRLTQKQADQIKKRAEQGGPMRFRFRPGGPGGPGGPGFGPPGGPPGPDGDGPPGQRRHGDFLMPAPPPPGDSGDEVPGPPPGVPG
jgi:hypothetical protein